MHLGGGRKLLLQGTGVVGIDLDGIEGLCVARQRCGQDASTRSNLEDALLWGQRGTLEDLLHDELITQKNLPEVLPMLWDISRHALNPSTGATYPAKLGTAYRNWPRHTGGGAAPGCCALLMVPRQTGGVLRRADYPPPNWRGPLAMRSIRQTGGGN